MPSWLAFSLVSSCWGDEMTKMLVCGGRDYDDVPWMWMQLDRIALERGVKCVIDGGQKHMLPGRGMVGADYWANQWALARGLSTEQYFAAWLELGKAAGPIRNKHMLDVGKPDFIVAFPGGKGTANMMMLGKVAGVEVIEIGQRP